MEDKNKIENELLDTGLEQDNDKDELLRAFRESQKDFDKRLKEAKSRENTAKLIAGLAPALSQMATAEMQMRSGAANLNPGYTGPDPSKIDMTSDILNERQQNLRETMSQYRMLKDQDKQDIRQIGNRLVKVGKDGQAEVILDKPEEAEMTEYQKRMLDLREKALQKEDSKKESVPKLTKAQEKVDTEFAKTYNEFVTRGGIADAEKNINQIYEAIGELEKSDNMTGSFVGNMPRAVRESVLPKSVAVQEAVEEVVQRNLRLVLGAQFTEKEGDRLISRAYNPRLSEQENIKRLKRLATQIQEAARSKERAARYYEENGTLKGYKGFMPKSANDFLKEEKTVEKVTVEKDGKRFKLPKSQLETAKKQGYSLVE